LELLFEERVALEAIASNTTLPHRAVREARGLLMAADGVANSVIAVGLGVSRSTVLGWRRDFVEHGVDWVGKVRPGRGPKPTISQERIEEMVHDTLHTKPSDGSTHWSVRSMAKHSGLSKSTIQKVWSARRIRPHLIETFKLSNDKRFEEKLRDVVDLYLNPPPDSVILSVDEKSQIQALNRTQPSLPLKPGRAGTMTHDYQRNGTTTLFAALNILTGMLLFKCMPRHRNGEFVTFLRLIDRSIEKGKKIHLIVDNYGTHNHANVQAWLAKHPRVTLHFIPTSSSWLNLVERWFRDLTDKKIRRGSFGSVADLIAAIEDYIAHHNADPKPYRWTKTAEEIIEKVRRGRVTLQQLAA
jgi:transposase/transcriptional regulator with XRE-family HTH domain